MTAAKARKLTKQYSKKPSRAVQDEALEYVYRNIKRTTEFGRSQLMIDLNIYNTDEFKKVIIKKLTKQGYQVFIRNMSKLVINW